MSRLLGTHWYARETLHQISSVSRLDLSTRQELHDLPRLVLCNLFCYKMCLCLNCKIWTSLKTAYFLWGMDKRYAFIINDNIMARYSFNLKFTHTWEGWRDCDETLLLTQRGSSSPSNTKVQLLQELFFIITSNLAHLFYVLLKLNHLLPEIRLLHFPCFEPDIRVVHCEPKNILMSICDLNTFH